MAALDPGPKVESSKSEVLSEKERKEAQHYQAKEKKSAEEAGMVWELLESLGLEFLAALEAKEAAEAAMAKENEKEQTKTKVKVAVKSVRTVKKKHV